jgi:lysozyme family protein
MILASDIIDAILQREGVTFTDRPADCGGPTCCGITLATYRAYRAPDVVTVDDLKRLDPPTARKVYQHVYIDSPGFGQIADPSLQALMVDAGVQHGTETAVKMLQRAIGVTPDGLLGPVSLAAINSHDPRSLRSLLCGARIRLYGALVSHDPELAVAKSHGYELQAENAFGWANRIAQFVETLI